MFIWILMKVSPEPDPRANGPATRAMLAFNEAQAVDRLLLLAELDRDSATEKFKKHRDARQRTIHDAMTDAVVLRGFLDQKEGPWYHVIQYWYPDSEGPPEMLDYYKRLLAGG